MKPMKGKMKYTKRSQDKGSGKITRKKYSECYLEEVMIKRNLKKKEQHQNRKAKKKGEDRMTMV